MQKFLNRETKISQAAIPINFFLIFSGETQEAYETLPEEEKQKVRTILYIMDRFSISGKAYHELSQLEQSLPRTHLIESCAKVLDANWTVTRTPGASDGAELPFEVLLRNEISNYVSYIYCILLIIFNIWAT